jgi:hypothetical protein
MDYWEEQQDAHQTTMAPEINYLGRPTEENGWIERQVKFENHIRDSKVYADASATLTIKAHPNRNTMGIELAEWFEMSNGNTRMHTITVSLTQKNIDALESVLAELRAAKAKARA